MIPARPRKPRVTRRLGASRRQRFEALERARLRPWPGEPYVYVEWKLCAAALVDMSLETIAPLSDDPFVSLPAVTA